MPEKCPQLIRLVLLTSLLSAKALGADFSFAGNFAQDDNVRLFNFTLSSAGSVGVRSWSYAGGKNAAGTTIPRGGMDPTLTIFDANGDLVATNGDGGCDNVPADAVTSYCWDSYIRQTLPAGTYTVALTESANAANGISIANSFVYAGQGNFTISPAGGPSSGFWDFSYDKRTSAYAVDITGVSQAASSDVLITTSALPARVTNAPLTFQFGAAGGVPPYQWSFGLGGPPAGSGLSLSLSGILSGTPTAAGSYSIPIKITDSISQSTTRSVTWLVVTPLSISALPLQQGTVGTGYNSQAFSSTGGTGSVSWTVSAGGLPPGLTLVPGVGTLGISGTPAVPGSFVFSVQATDGVTTAVASAAITIKSALTIISSPLPSATSGLSYGPVAVSAVGGFGTLNWSATGLPAGLTMSSAGQISGTPTVSGTFSGIGITVTDSSGAVASAIFSIRIVAQPLTIAIPASLPPVTAVKANVSATFAANGGTPPFTWSASGLPAGTSLSGGGVLSGAPSIPGAYSVAIQVSDSQNVVTSVKFDILVVGLVTASVPTATAGVSYSQQLTAAGSAIFSGGGLPAGLSLSAAGLISGTPTVPGSYLVTVTVSVSGVSSSATITITVNAAAGAVRISSTALPGGSVQAAYSYTLSAVGGTAPYTWSILGGTLPAGFSLTAATGLIAGATTSPGTFVVTVQATDSAGAKAIAVINLNIAPAPIQILSTAFPSGVVGVGYPSQIINGSGGVAPYTITLSGILPPGMNFSNGTLSGVPTTPGTFRFTFTLTDSNNPSATVTEPGQITIAPNTNASLILSQASLSYAVSTGTTTISLPAPRLVTVASSVVAQLLNYNLSVSPQVPWLTVRGGGSTPGGISVSLNSQALTVPPGEQTTSIQVTCAAPSPCSGNTQTIGVSLTVNAPPPVLSLTNSLLSFATTGSVIPPLQSLGIQNTGGGALTIQSVTAADRWLSISGVPALVASGLATQVTVSANPAGLAPGYYLSQIKVVSSGGTQTVQVGLNVVASAIMTLSSGGAQFNLQAADAGASLAGSFRVGVSTKASWRASTSDAEWLTLNTRAGSSTPEQPGEVKFAVDSKAAPRSPGTYFGAVQVASDTVVNSPLNFVVALTVADSSVPAEPVPSPAGFLFVTNTQAEASSAPVSISVSSSSPVAYQASTSTSDGANWLSVSPSTGTASSTSPATSTVSVNARTLQPGAYHGGVSYATSSGVVRTVNVDVVVTATATISPTTISPLAAGCTASSLIAAQTGLVDSFSLRTALPTPLLLEVVDNCGSPVADAQVNVTFSNGDAPLVLSAASSVSGIYSGTWTPVHAASQASLTATVTAAGLGATVSTLHGQIVQSALPLLTQHSTTNFAAPVVGAALAPGTIVQLYGSNLANTATAATSLPLSTSLGGTSVTIGGIPAALYYVSPSQINAQVPFELAPGGQYQIAASVNGALTVPDTLQIAATAPGVAAYASGFAIAQHALDGSLITTDSPARPGEYVVLYLAGLGITDPPVADGVASPAVPLAQAQVKPFLTLNGTVVPVAFAGLTPNQVSLYQINFQVPADSPDGNLAMILSQDGVRSNGTILPVRK